MFFILILIKGIMGLLIVFDFNKLYSLTEMKKFTLKV